jgi:hypothetical protein
MATFERVSLLMSEVGPVLAPMAIDEWSEEKAWGVVLEDDLNVLVQFDEDKNCLVLSCELGTPPPGDRHALYELLLQLNYHWTTTGGNRMALDGPGGGVVQVYEIGAEQLDATGLSSVLSSFAGTARAWKKIVERPASTQSSTLDLRADLGMRV